MDMNNQQFIDMERPIKLYGQDDANQWAVGAARRTDWRMGLFTFGG